MGNRQIEKTKIKPGKYPSRADLFFGQDLDTEDEMEKLQAATNKKYWDQAISIAYKLLTSKKIAFVICNVDQKYAIPASKFMYQIINQWPIEKRQILVEKLEPKAKSLSEKAQSQKDWESIAEQYPFCKAGLTAHLQVAELLFEHGNWKTALYWLEQTINLNNPDLKNHPQFFSMLAICKASIGDAKGSKEALETLRSFGDITDESKGQKWKVAELVEKTQAAMKMAARNVDKVEKTNDDVKGKILIPTKPTDEVIVPAYYWIPTTIQTYEQHRERLTIEQYAQIIGDILYYSNAKSLRAYDLKNKKQLWLHGLEKEPKFKKATRTKFSYVYVNSRMPEGTMDTLLVGKNMLVNLGQGYGIGQSTAGGHMVNGGKVPDNLNTNTLVSLVGPDGKEVWKANGLNETDSDFLKTMVFLNMPCRHSGQLIFTAVSTKTMPSMHLVSLDEKTGTMLWHRFVCTYNGILMHLAEAGGGRNMQNLINKIRLGRQKGGPTMGDDPSPITDGKRIYISSRFGHISSFDFVTGKPLWIYKFVFSPKPTYYSFRNNNFGWSLNRPILWENLLIAAPTNSDKLIALDKMSGKVIWTFPREDNAHLLGIYNGKIIISGNEITAVNAATGKKAWSLLLEAAPFGRGTIYNGAIYHPAETGLIIVNAENGKVISKRKWDGDAWENAGNVVITGGKFVICGYNKITVYDSVETDLNNPIVPLKKLK